MKNNYGVEFKAINISNKKKLVAITRELEQITKKYDVEMEIILNPHKEDATGLTEHEKKVILDVATRKGCDRDGDILSFFVKEDESVVEVVNR